MLRKSALGAAFVLTALLVAAPAQAAFTCAYVSAQARVNLAMSAPGDLVIINRSGLKIMVNGVQCGSATVKNTNAVFVTSDAAEQTLVLQFGGGAFAPGKTKESRGTSEIEFHVNLGGGTDSVLIRGGAQAETFRLGTGGMNLNADGDADLLTTGVDKWDLAGGGGADTVSGAGAFGTGGKFGGPLIINGDAGHDTLTGGSSMDVMHGGTGNDRMSGGGGSDVMLGEAGRDTMDGGDGPDQITPGLGNDRVNGGVGVDQLYGEPGLDGSDDMHGGSGTDYAYYYQRTANLKVSLDNRANDGQSGEKDNIHTDIESFTSGSGNDRLVGSSADNSFDAGPGNDVVVGGAGDDSINGGYGVTSGNDTLSGGTGDDGISGSEGNDSIDGGAGEDNLYGDEGNDTVKGGAGDDNIQEGSVATGSDLLIGGTGYDYLNYGQRSAPLQLRLDTVANDGAAGEFDNIAGDFETIYGGSNNDVFVGNALDNRFYGGVGIDNASGGSGQDRLYGGDGADTLTGDDGHDYLFGEADNDILAGIDGGYDELYGGLGTDTCNGDVADYKQDCP